MAIKTKLKIKGGDEAPIKIRVKKYSNIEKEGIRIEGQKLKELGYSNRKIADLLQVGRNVVNRIFAHTK